MMSLRINKSIHCDTRRNSNLKNTGTIKMQLIYGILVWVVNGISWLLILDSHLFKVIHWFLFVCLFLWALKKFWPVYFRKMSRLLFAQDNHKFDFLHATYTRTNEMVNHSTNYRLWKIQNSCTANIPNSYDINPTWMDFLARLIQI
jgi:hypothetical protein